MRAGGTPRRGRSLSARPRISPSHWRRAARRPTVGAKAVALKVPVLKENGQPVMTLTDLLTLVGGRVVQKGDTLQVKA